MRVSGPRNNLDERCERDEARSLPRLLCRCHDVSNIRKFSPDNLGRTGRAFYSLNDLWEDATCVLLGMEDLKISRSVGIDTMHVGVGRRP
jgi:hypothetical protein